MEKTKYFQMNLQRKTVRKKNADGAPLYTAVANTLDVDRDGEVVVPKGAILDEFEKNPVMLNIHNHRKVPVGKVENITVNEEEVLFDFVFAPTEEGQEMKTLYDQGFMSAFSIGFIPQKFLFISEDTPSKYTFEVANGEDFTLDLARYEKQPYGIIPLWEMLEISPVPVPANPAALLQRGVDEMVQKFAGSHSKSSLQIYQKQLFDQLKEATEVFASVLAHDNVSNVIPCHECGVMEDGAASELLEPSIILLTGGTGEKDDLDWSQYSQLFAHVDMEKSDQLTAYRLCHHRYVEAEDNYALELSPAALKDCMKELLENQESFGEDAKGVYDHLADHYSQLGLEIPEFRTYEDGELDAILNGDSEGTDKNADATADSSEEDVDSGAQVGNPVELNIDALVAALKDEMANQLKEFDLAHKVRMTCLVESIKAVEKLLLELANQKDAEPDEGDSANDAGNDEEDDGKEVEDIFSKASSMLASLNLN